MPPTINLQDYIATFPASPLVRFAHTAPWEITSQSPAIVTQILASLAPEQYDISDNIAIHSSATVEPGAVLKGPLVVGANSFIGTGAYLRSGCWIADNCSIGPGVELKSSYLFTGSKLAHFNFVGDSIVGADVNLEAGSIVCNYRNEREEKEILVRLNGRLQGTGVKKFGALIGDACRIGANAVLAPGVLLKPNQVVGRAQLLDQE